jgi:hypothetical protein
MSTTTKITVTIDCGDPEALAAFWARFVGYRVQPRREGSPYVIAERPDGFDGPAMLTFQEVPEPKTTKARVHLDLLVDHARPMVDEMIEAGATLDHVEEAGDWTTRVLRDPAGNELCVIGPD